MCTSSVHLKVIHANVGLGIGNVIFAVENTALAEGKADVASIRIVSHSREWEGSFNRNESTEGSMPVALLSSG